MSTQRIETQHNVSCNKAFGRKDPGCARCVELMNGAPARKGWQTEYYARKKIQEAIDLRSVQKHDCKKSGCSVVCTFGEW